ncbi:MAG: hypothetical protein ACFB15_31445 [Cyclobacteriaceae bacterium]
MSQKTNPFPHWIWGVYGVLFTVSIPWYLPAKTSMKLVLALPLWLLCSIGAILLTAGFTAWVISYFWKEY